jgi:TP901 family phage tail tape measure protein
MADVNANIGVNINASAAMAELKALQRQLATFHSSIAKTSVASVQAQKGLQTNLLNSINATGQFHAQMGLVRNSTESFTHALEKNKLSMREYFRFAGGSTRTFGKLFKQEFNTIGKVAEERVRRMQTQYIKMGRDASGAIQAMSITPRTLDMNNYANKTAVAAQKQALLNQLLRQGSTNLLNFGKNTQWAGRQLMVGFTIPLMYFGGVAAKTFMDLEAQAIKFKRVYGDIFTTSEETNKALSDVQMLAEGFTKYGIAVSKTMEMAASAAAMGKTGADLTAQVAGATRLAVLGNVEQEQALETTISLTNAFGIAAEDLANKINFLNSVENQTVVSIEDLTIAIPKAGPVVKQLGGSVEDLAFFLTAMKEGGINASEGANALKSGLASLINPSDKASKMLAGLGININAIVEGNQGNIRETVIGFSRALDTLDPLNRARAIEQLFGKFQFSRLSTLFQNVTKDGTQASRVLEMATSSVEELAILSERELGTLENAIGVNFKESVEKLKLAIAPIGETFLKAITPIVEVVGRLLDKFNNLGDGTKKFIVIAATLVGAIGPVLLMTFGLLANGVANIIKLFITMRSGFLRAGTNTNLLAQQTNYLNSEQLESATIAASLNQAHTRLTQSFNIETTAVRLLRQAYIDATFAAANFARANPGMMIPGKGFVGGKSPNRFSSGTTKVPGRGNKDTVPSMLTPGEAVIPAPIARDPRFEPIIDAMVNGNLQGFNGGSTGVTRATKTSNKSIFFDGINYPVNARADDIVNKINAAIDENPNKAQAISRRMRDLVNPEGEGSNRKGRRPKSITATSLGLAASRVNKATVRTGSDANPEISKARRLIGYSDPITGKSAKVEKFDRLYAALRGAGLSPEEAKNFIGSNESHIKKSLNTDNKWFEGHVARDVKGLNNYLNRLDPNRTQPGTQSSFEKLLLAVEKDRSNLPGITEKQIKTLKSDLEFVKSGRHPVNAAELQRVLNLADFDEKISKNEKLIKDLGISEKYAKGSHQAKGVKVLGALRKKSGYSFYKALDVLSLGGDRNNPSAIRESVNLGERVNKSSGRGATVRGIDGEYRINDKKVFVKGFESLDNAKAEMKANALARNLHGLVSPEGTIRMVQDPNNPGRQIPALINDFDPKFTEENMKRQKFNADSMAKQLVASALRGDKDVKTSNMSGRYAVDPGSAYIYDTSSGVRKPSAQMSSMQEMIEKNLRLVDGTRTSKNFSNSIESLMSGMTAEQFDQKMKNEIKNLLSKADKALIDSGYSTTEAAKIKARLQGGLDIDFKNIHNRYLARKTVAVKPSEVLQDKDGIRPIRAIKKPKGIKTASSKDTLLAPKEQASAVRNVPKIMGGYKGIPRVSGLNNAPLVGTGMPYSALASGLLVPGSQIEELTKSIQTNTDSSDDNTKANSDSTKTAKETKKDARAQRAQRVGTVAGPLAGAAGIASMGAYMTGNMGAGNAMLGVAALASIAPMLTNPYAAAATAAIALGGGFLLLNKQLEKAAKKQAEFVKSTSGTTKNMEEVGKITGFVGASQIMERKRESGSFGKYNDVQRAGQMFGDSFLTSDIGKKMVQGFVENMQKFGSQQASSDFALQLSTYVSDGVLTNDQAKGIAEQIGIQLGSNKYTLEIQGNLRTILGPNGENLAVDPLRVRTQIIAQAGKRTDRELSALEKTQSTGSSGSTASAKIAALATNNLEIIRAQADAQNILYVKQIDTLNNQLKTTNNLEKQLEIKQQIASLESKQSRDAETFNTAYANRLSTEVKIFKDKIFNTGMGALTDESRREDAYFDSLKSTVKDTYKGTAMESMATKALEKLATLSDKTRNPLDGEKLKSGFETQKAARSFEVQMSLLLKDKVLNPEQSNAILDLFSGKEPELQQTLDLGIKRHGPEKTVAMLDYFTNLSLDPRKTTTISTQIINSDPKTFNQIGEAMASLLALDGHEVNISAYIKEAEYEGLVKLGKELDKVEQMPTPITKESIIKYFEEGAGIGTTGMTTNNLELLMSQWQDFDALPDSIQKEAISKFLTIYSTEFKDEAARLAFVRESAARMASSQGLSSFGENAVYNQLVALGTNNMAEFQAQQVKKYIGDLQAAGGKTGLGIDQDDIGGKRDTTLDDLLRKLKLTRDASINAQGGLEELRRVFKDSSGDIKKYSGVIQQLNDIGADKGFIDFVSGLDNETQKTYVNVNLLKKGVVELTDAGKEAMELYKESALGEFHANADSEIEDLNAQVDGFKRLTAAGLGVADSLRLIENTEKMRALSAAKSVELLDELIKKEKELNLVAKNTKRATNPLQAFKDEMQSDLDYFDFLERQAKASVKLEIDRINSLIDANERLIETKERSIEEDITRPIQKFNQDISVIDRAIEKINEKYDAQENALNKISEINDDIADKESERLTIANALTQGDIAAAAKALQEQKEAEARRARENNSRLLQSSREREISRLTNSEGLTKKQIEEKIYSLEEKRLPIINEILKLQDENYKLQNVTLRAQEDSLKETLKGIDAAKFAYEQQIIAIEAAQYKALGYNGMLLNGVSLLERMKALWNDIAKASSSANVSTGGSTTTTTFSANGQKITVPKNVGQAWGFNTGGMVPKYFAAGGFSRGTDTIPAMLTAGEYVVKKSAVDSLGVGTMNSINNGSIPSSPVYNYSLSVNVEGSNSNADDIARAVMSQIKRVDSQRVRGAK